MTSTKRLSKRLATNYTPNPWPSHCATGALISSDRPFMPHERWNSRRDNPAVGLDQIAQSQILRPPVVVAS